MASPYPKEFRDDVVRVAENREPGVTIEQIAKDFGVHPMTLQKWLQRARMERDENATSTAVLSSAQADQLSEANRRIRLLEQENEVLRRAAAYLSQAHLPSKGSTRS